MRTSEGGRGGGKQKRINSINPCSKSSATVQRFVNTSLVPISNFPPSVDTDVIFLFLSTLRENNSSKDTCSNWKLGE